MREDPKRVRRRDADARLAVINAEGGMSFVAVHGEKMGMGQVQVDEIERIPTA